MLLKILAARLDEIIVLPEMNLYHPNTFSKNLSEIIHLNFIQM